MLLEETHSDFIGGIWGRPRPTGRPRPIGGIATTFGGRPRPIIPRPGGIATTGYGLPVRPPGRPFVGGKRRACSSMVVTQGRSDAYNGRMSGGQCVRTRRFTPGRPVRPTTGGFLGGIFKPKGYRGFEGSFEGTPTFTDNNPITSTTGSFSVMKYGVGLLSLGVLVYVVGYAFNKGKKEA